jgi:hypothetical protein
MKSTIGPAASIQQASWLPPTQVQSLPITLELSTPGPLSLQRNGSGNENSMRLRTKEGYRKNTRLLRSPSSIHSSFSHIYTPIRYGNEGQSKSSRNSLTSTIWCTMNSYRLDSVLMVIPLRKFCSSCAMEFGWSGRQGQWFLHRATHRREKHSCHHATTILPGSRSDWLLADWLWPNSERFQKKPSAGAG